LAARAAVLTAAAALLAGGLLAGCLRAPAARAGGPGCAACHAVHYARDGSCVDCHRGRATAARKELAHERLLRGRAAQFRLANGAAPAEGRRLVDALACRRCHAIAGTGNRLASDLDRVVWQREQEALVASIREPVEGMPPFGLDAARAESIVSFLLRSGDPRASEEAYRVRFETRASAAGGAGAPTTVFERQCGPCHRVLTPAGLLGTGTAGPNLSGLFTAFYPKTAPREAKAASTDGSWTGPALADWLRNPRAARPGTTMPPVALNESDLQRLLGELGAPVR
jgi:cytochrome c2